MTNIAAKLEALHTRALARSSSRQSGSGRKPHIRVYASQPVAEIETLMRQALRIKVVVRKEVITRWPESKPRHHASGASCPHCRGTGVYCFYSDTGRSEKCYRCDGKGCLGYRDMDYLTKRMEGAGPICWTVGAPAA